MTERQIEVFEGTTEALEGTLTDSTGHQISLDDTYLMEFYVIKSGTRSVIFFKSSNSEDQIDFDDPTHGHYQIYRIPADTIGNAGTHVFVLTVKKNDQIFHAEQGTFIIRGIDLP